MMERRQGRDKDADAKTSYLNQASVSNRASARLALSCSSLSFFLSGRQHLLQHGCAKHSSQTSLVKVPFE